ncbi:MAG: hypothetical protein ACRDT0_13010 [Pseudonocardiaceae bacterium]
MVLARRRSLAVSCGILALLLGSGLPACSAGGDAPDGTVPAGQIVDDRLAAATGGATVVDSTGTPFEPEYADVVQSVYRALAVGDLERLRHLYTGDDWAGQAELLAQRPVRAEVLSVLRTHPANLAEGYVYPGFSVTGWTGRLDRVDGARLGLAPDDLPDPTTGYRGYQTAFFLAPQDGGPLQWRGIDRLPAVTSAG